MSARWAFDGVVAHKPLRLWPPWMVELLEQREELPGPAFDAAVVHAFRTHLFADFEDPGRDADLGEPVDGDGPT